MCVVGVMAEKMVKDLPKYMKKFSDTMMVVAGELGNRVWDLKTEIEQRIGGTSKKDDVKTKSSSRPSSGKWNISLENESIRFQFFFFFREISQRSQP